MSMLVTTILKGLDEIYYEDTVASLYERNSLTDILRRTTEEVFIPITVGGGLRDLEDIAAALKNGADKVAVNTAAIKRPDFLNEIIDQFGSQCLVLSVQAKKKEIPGRPITTMAASQAGLTLSIGC